MSRDSRKAWSTACGMILANKGADSSRQGLVLISISQGLKFSSIIKSKPKSSKLCFSLCGDNFK